jgi:hypothetical protein
MLKALAAGAALLAAATTPAAASAPAPPPKVTIGVVAANGSGCPEGSFTKRVSRGTTTFTLENNSYTASVGVSAGPLDARKNCQLAFDVRVPRGYTYALADIGYRGHVHLAAGASGSQSASFYFSGMSQTTRTRHDLSVPRRGVWQHRDKLSPLLFLPCGDQRYLQVNTDLRVNAGRSGPKTTSWLSMDSISVYRIALKRC